MHALRERLDRLATPLHALLALSVLWLLATSFWLGLYRRVPQDPGFINASHVAVGFAVLLMVAIYVLGCTLGGRWRLYFPWLAGQGSALRRDLANLARGERPMSEGGGLFGAIEGLLLVALLAAGVTGAAWYVMQGADAVLAWRTAHVVAARSAAALLLLHALSVTVHLIDLVRD